MKTISGNLLSVAPRHFLLTPSAALMAAVQLASFPTFAQENSLAIEEVIVQAQRRSESLQDVPVAVSAVDGEQLIQQGLGDLQEMATYVPSLNIVQSPGTVQIYMRGLGSAQNTGFEQSVGLFVDGLYVSKAPQFTAPFLDVANVEVLRGPQGTLFGKNTIAGAITVNTVRPSDEFEAILRTNFDVEYGDYTVDAIVSTPLTDSLSARFAVRKVDMQGYIDNTFVNRDEVQSEQSVYRGSVLWDINDSASLFVKYEQAEVYADGKSLITPSAGPWEPVLRGIDPNFSFSTDTRSTSVVEFQDIDSENLTVNLDIDIGGFQLTSITGYSEYSLENFADPDTVAIDAAVFNPREEFSQWTQEIRLASPVGGKFDYIVGAFYLSNDLEANRQLGITPANVAGGPGIPPVFGVLPPIGTFANFDQETESYALFGSINWHFSDRLRATAGIRYTYEEKSAFRNLIYTDATGIPLDEAYNPATDPISNILARATLPVLGLFEHDINGDRDVDDWSPTLRVSYDLTDDAMFYASVSRAFKSGGYNEAGNSGDEPGEFPPGGSPASFEFDDEEALSFEVGGKMSFFDRRANLNFAIFSTEFSNLQVSAFQGESFVVGNAADVTSQGVEIDAVARLSESWTLTGSMTYLDATYDSYATAPCTVAQTAQTAAMGIPPGSCVQDLTGRTLPFAPEFSGVLALRYERQLGNLLFGAVADVNYAGDQFLATDLDPQTIQEANTRVNSRVAISAPDKRWELAIVGRNLTDESVANFASDAFLLTGVTWQVMQPPRTVELQFNVEL